MTTRQELAERDLEILRGLASGHTFARIGRDSRPPVSDEVARFRARGMYGRLGAKNQAHAVALGYERGLLTGTACPGCRCLGPAGVHARADRTRAS